ncbi:MAG: cupin domain-containing protein, partial [Sphingomonadales bacterium]
MSWVSSPQSGVDRRMLDRIGDEVARATSIVRYAPGSYFPAHSHGGGEEFLVLEGVFSDEHGDYGPGYYVRNPRGSRHTPSSKDGCTIFVKLWQMEEADQDFVRIDTQSAEFQPSSTKGIEYLPLHKFEGETVRMEKWAEGATAQRHYADGAEYLVLEGHLRDVTGDYGEGDWLRM